MIVCTRAWTKACTPIISRRCLSQQTLNRPAQSYISTSHDPYLNLSIEHFLLQSTAPGSAVLFLYVNRPSVIIGRNQNPWLEVNLALLDLFDEPPSQTELPALGSVDLVRRRSGGGTVFHDEGNVNWTIICPSSVFTRDKHAEMVVRGLRKCEVHRARVNERHDIVLDQGERTGASDLDDTHSSAYQVANGFGPQPLKVSGSAYKLTRNRALHHGTCLLSSPNLNTIPDYLHSPAKPYITARGVESVSSPVGNILLDNDDFISSVQQEFIKMYQAVEPTAVGIAELEQPAVRKGYDELKSPEWTYLQTPQFLITNKFDASASWEVELTARYGALSGGVIKGSRDEHVQPFSLAEDEIGQKVHEIRSWQNALGSLLYHIDHSQRDGLVSWLQRMLPPLGR